MEYNWEVFNKSGLTHLLDLPPKAEVVCLSGKLNLYVDVLGDCLRNSFDSTFVFITNVKKMCCYRFFFTQNVSDSTSLQKRGDLVLKLKKRNTCTINHVESLG